MTVSYNWLKDYLKFDLSPEKVAEVLTFTGLEVEHVETVEQIPGGLAGVFVGKVLECEMHPDSDHLHITKVDIGQGEPLQVVCGAPNVAAGQKVMLATVGTKLVDIHGEELKLKKSKIRGVESFGMICAQDELGIGEDHAGIMVLDDSAVPGTPAKDYLNLACDTVYEIGLTPNRIDGAGHIGVARDLYAWCRLNDVPVEWTLPQPDIKLEGEGEAVPVEVLAPEDAPRYIGITFKDVKVGPSPEWLRDRLNSVGQRPINNIVDITNFILNEYCQPLHCFDLNQIEGRKVVVRRAAEGEKMVTLDGVERTLSGRDLVIANTREPMCIAGVFGGLDSGVTEETKNVFIESAYFNPTSIRKTARFHGLQTDASFRYERGCDPNITLYALKRAALLVKELAGGTVSSEVKDVVNGDFTPVRVQLKFDYLNKIAGQNIEKDVAVNILKDLDCQVVELTDAYVTVDVPTCKVDVYRPADLVEEILRIYGYDNIAIPTKINASLNVNVKPDKEKIQKEISIFLAANGFYEIMNNSLTKSAYTKELNSFDEARNLKIMNPLSSDLDVMRQSLMFGGLESIARNQSFKSFDMKFFEFGNVYFFNAENKQTVEKPLNPYTENYRLDLLITGNDKDELWNSRAQSLSFYDLKKYVLGIIHKLGINADNLEMTEGTESHYDYSLVYSLNNNKLITIGKVNAKTLKMFDVKKEVFHATFDWDAILTAVKGLKTISFETLPKFPSVRRDLAFILDKNVTFEQIKKLAFATERNILTSVNLFDIYEGDKIPAGKKQYAVSFTLQDKQKTLTDKVIEKTMARIQSAIEQQLNATLR